MVDLLSGSEGRRRRIPQAKNANIQQAMELGMAASRAAHLHDINANQIFNWRRQYKTAL